MSMLNKLANCKNPFQGEAKKVLCICSAGLLRSPTIAKVLSEEYGYNTRAAGITEEYALIDVTDVLIEWADEIVVAGEGNKELLLINFPEADAKTIMLDIPDMYEYNSIILVDKIKNLYSDYLEETL